MRSFTPNALPTPRWVIARTGFFLFPPALLPSVPPQTSRRRMSRTGGMIAAQPSAPPEGGNKLFAASETEPKACPTGQSPQPLPQKTRLRAARRTGGPSCAYGMKKNDHRTQQAPH